MRGLKLLTALGQVLKTGEIIWNSMQCLIAMFQNDNDHLYRQKANLSTSLLLPYLESHYFQTDLITSRQRFSAPLLVFVENLAVMPKMANLGETRRARKHFF